MYHLLRVSYTEKMLLLTPEAEITLQVPTDANLIGLNFPGFNFAKKKLHMLSNSINLRPTNSGELC